MNVFYIHFHPEELSGRLAELSEKGLSVRGHSTKGVRAAIAEPMPDALLLSLENVPSHAYAYADWFWQAKKRQPIPIVFIGGTEQTVESAKKRYPSAHFCTYADLLPTLENLR